MDAYLDRVHGWTRLTAAEVARARAAHRVTALLHQRVRAWQRLSQWTRRTHR